MSTVEEKALELVKVGRCKIKRLVSEETLFRKCLKTLGVAKLQAYFVLKLAAFLNDDDSDVETAMRIGPDAADAFDIVTKVFITSKQVAELYIGHESTLQKIAEQFDNSLIDKVTCAVLFYYNEEACKKFDRNIASKRKGYTLVTEEDVAALLFNCIEAAYDLDRKTWIPDTSQSFSQVAVVSVSTFNIKGTVQHDTYQRFLRDTFSTLNCDLHHLQELLWKDDSNIWSLNIFPGCAVDIGATEREAGVAIINAPNRNTIKVVDKHFTDHERLYSCRIQVADKLQICVEEERIYPVKESRQYLQFLSFSYHGRFRATKEEDKIRNIGEFIDLVKECCEDHYLPAIIGGDFNYDIRDIRALQDDPNIKIYCSESEHRKKTIDFLCTVHEDTFKTRMTMVPEFVRHHDIRQNIPEGFDQTEITNHLPISGLIVIYDTPSMSAQGLALQLTKLSLSD